MNDLNNLKQEALKAIEEVKDSKVLDELRIEYLSKKGKIQGLMSQMKDLSAEEKPKFGQLVNDLKVSVTNAFESKKEELDNEILKKEQSVEELQNEVDSLQEKSRLMTMLDNSVSDNQNNIYVIND